MKKFVLFILSAFIFSCSNDADLTLDDEIAKDENTNSSPIISTSEFTVAEHSPSGTSIGTISSTDADNDDITFTIDSATDILIDETTGELTIGDNLKLDFETTESISFTVSAFDGKVIIDKLITLNIEDINEIDLLNEDQIAIIDHFKHLSLFLDPSSPDQEMMRKWNEPMKIFLDGTISPSFQTTVESVIAEYNALTTSSGNFEITLVPTAAEANTELFFGTKEEVEFAFPEMYDIIENLSVDGYARASFQGDFYTTAEIWISNEVDVLFKHELGHAIGMGHSHICEAPNPSVMCATIALESDFLEIEEQVIKYFYHEDMPSGLTAEQIDTALANLILLEG